MPYNKPYLSPSEQLELIKNRGMAVSDAILAQSCLERIGYYRLSGYWYPYRESTGSGSNVVVADTFRDGTEFSEIVKLYVFDKKLRLLLLDVIERIEIALRVQITLQLGRHGAQAHRDALVLHGNFSRRTSPKTSTTDHLEWLRRHDEAFKKSKEEFSKHFKSKYPGEPPPIWIAAELWDFGAMSVLFSGLKKNDQKSIASKFEVHSFEIMENWLHSINIARNICAHHGRLWNKANVRQPKWPIPQDCLLLSHLYQNTHAQTRVYGMAALCAYLLRSINPNSKWTNRFKELVKEFPKSSIVNIRSAGFIDGWENQEIWN